MWANTLQIVELQRSKLEREKQLTALRTELNEIKEETRKKGKETQKQVPLIRPRDAASPRPPPTPPTVRLLYYLNILSFDPSEECSSYRHCTGS